MTNQVFGSDWTSDKLERVGNYVGANTTVFKQNVRNSYFTMIYVNAFTGTGLLFLLQDRDERRAGDAA